jgi:hypothetical protein
LSPDFNLGKIHPENPVGEKPPEPAWLIPAFVGSVAL